MHKKLKITFLVYHPNLGGGDRVISIYANYLQRQGHSVHVVGLALQPPSFLRAAKDFIKNKGRRVRHTLHFDNAGVPVTLIKNTGVLKSEHLPDSDIVIATFWVTAEWAANLGASKGAKAYFVQGHEYRFPGVDVERVKATYRAPLKKIVISNGLDAVMRSEFKDTPVALIKNSVDSDQFFAPPREKNKMPTLGFLYHNSSLKGVDISLAAIEKIQNKFPNLKIISFGACQPNKDLPLPPNCEFHFEPHQQKIRELYAQCDVWLCGSRLEGFHLPPMEAMACRCPVVSTAVGGPADVVENGKQGYVVPIEDSDALANKAIQVLELNADDWRKMSDAAYDTATCYSWDDAGALFEAALYKIDEDNRNSET